MISGAVGMVIFATCPVAPPRMVDAGLVDTVTEHSSAYRLLEPPALVNQYAAMPSLPAGWDLLVGIAIVSAATGVAPGGRTSGCTGPSNSAWTSSSATSTGTEAVSRCAT